MNAGQSIWDKLTRATLVLLVIASVFAVVQWYRPVVLDNERMRQRKLQLEREIAKEKETGKRLDNSIKSMGDRRTVERLARERLSYARPGENVIHFESPAASNNVPEKP